MVAKPTIWWVCASTALYACSFPPVNLPFLIFAALVPWFSFLNGCTSRQAFWSGLLFGCLFWLHQMVWLLPFVFKWTGSWPLALVPWLLVPLLMSWIFGGLGWILRICIHARAWWAIPCAWALVEIFRSTIPYLMFPWGLIAFPLWRFPILAQLAGFGNIYLVSAWVVLVNVVLWKMLESHARAEIIRGFVATMVLFGFSAARYYQPPAATKRTITIGQTAVDMAFGDPATMNSRTSAAARRLLDQASAQGSELLVLPEHVPGMPNTPIVPSLFGDVVSVKGRHYRAAVARDQRGNQQALKSRLVIFGEYVPLRDQLPALQAFNLPTGDLAAASTPSIVHIAGLKIAPLICFEAIFPDVATHQSVELGAQMLAVMSIDDWYQGTSAIDQITGATVWRSIECGLPAARAASLGVSLACDSRGNLLARAPLNRETAMRVELPVPVGSDGWAFRGYFWILALAGTLAAYHRSRTEAQKNARQAELA